MDSYIYAETTVSDPRPAKDTLGPVRYQALLAQSHLEDLVHPAMTAIYVSVVCATWRNAFQLNRWFVDHAGPGILLDDAGGDRCRIYHEHLTMLLAYAERHAKAFDEGEDNDSEQWHSTIVQLQRILSHPDVHKLDFYYECTW
jgi:hypothetical protein